MSRSWVLPAVLVLVAVRVVAAQDKKSEKKDGPKVLVAAPLGVAPGQAARVSVRGLKLDGATEVRFPGVAAAVKLLGKGKAAVPNQQSAARVGDTQVEMEVTLPREAAAGRAAFVVVTPAGTSEPHDLLVEHAVPVVAEKEPNNGFRQAQSIALPQAVDGVIGQPQDVDVFRFECKAGQKVVLEVVAARPGSGLDGVLMLHDAGGRLLATSDDAEGADPRIEVTLPRDGAYLVSVLDAHDQGGPAHVYRLAVRLATK